MVWFVAILQWAFDIIPPLRMAIQRMLAQELEIEVTPRNLSSNLAVPGNTPDFFLVPLAIQITNHARMPNRIRRVTAYIERKLELEVLPQGNETKLDIYIEPMRSTETIQAFAVVPFTAHIAYIMLTPKPEPLHLTFHRVGGFFRKQHITIQFHSWMKFVPPSSLVNQREGDDDGSK